MTTGLLVSAVITTYDRPTRAKRAIESVREQTYDPLEVIVVEDGSDSGIEEWLQTEGFDEVTYVCHESNSGLAAARNTGLELASGKYVAYLDDDDVWKPERVERQMEAVGKLTKEEQADLGVVACAVEVRGPDESVLVINEPDNDGPLKREIMENGASTPPSTFLFSKSALEAAGGFDENLQSGIDHDIWMSLAVEGYHAHAVKDPLVITYRDGEESMVTNTDERIEGVEQYVEKWEPTYREWFGDEEGRRYGERYFAWVIGSLAGDLAAQGKFREAGRALRAIIGVCQDRRYVVVVLYSNVLTSVLKSVLPGPALKIARWIHRRGLRPLFRTKTEV